MEDCNGTTAPVGRWLCSQRVGTLNEAYCVTPAWSALDGLEATLQLVNVPGAWVGYSRTRKFVGARAAKFAKYPPLIAVHTVIGRNREKSGEIGSLHRRALFDQILHQGAVTPFDSSDSELRQTVEDPETSAQRHLRKKERVCPRFHPEDGHPYKSLPPLHTNCR